MKNVVIIVLSVALAHFKLPPASTQFIHIAHEATLEIETEAGEAMEIIELPEIIIEVPPTAIEANAPAETPVKEKISFKASKSVNIHSVQNTANRQFHQALENSERTILAENLHFHFDAFELKDIDDFNSIMSIADQLIFHPELKVSISGNADNIGSDHYNDVLSYNRVENVKTYLLELGVSADQITVSFNGESNPIADNDTEEGRSENRRVEMFLYQ